ncbi:hypothetical protein BH20VER3_BH20VER3_16890 [soil metagenome]
MTNCLVKASPAAHFFAGSLSLLLVTAWLFASNHCAVAEYLPKQTLASGEHESCPGHPASQPEKEQGGCDGQNCCKSLSAPVLGQIKSLVAADQFGFIPPREFSTLASWETDQHAAAIWEIDTGPPGASSFAESVLQRSLLAHAPPPLA